MDKEKITLGEDRLLYLGHASLRITTNEGKVIYVDPYAGDNYELGADLILVTHSHYDHSEITKIKNRNDDIKIITFQEALKNGNYQNFDLGYVKIETVEAGYNKYHSKDNCVGYILTLSDGITIYIAGDTYITPQMKELGARNLDYAFFPTDGIFTMTVEEAKEASKLVNAKHSIPYHMIPDALFSEEIAEKFDVDNRLIIKNNEEIILKHE